jgi:phytoene dehydrogenase-like protein
VTTATVANAPVSDRFRTLDRDVFDAVIVGAGTGGLRQSGDHGAPPSRASALLHGMVLVSYLQGPYQPAGGGQILSDRLAATLNATVARFCS